MTGLSYAQPGTWERLTNTFGPCMACERPGRPLFAYVLEPDHLKRAPWWPDPICKVEPDEPEGCYWCAWPAEQPLMVCPPCFGRLAAAERAALDEALSLAGAA